MKAIRELFALLIFLAPLCDAQILTPILTGAAVSGGGSNTVTVITGQAISAATASTKSITVGSNVLLIASCNVGVAGATATWNGASMTLDNSTAYNGATTTYVWSLYVTSGGTHNLTASWSGSHSSACQYLTVTSTLTSSITDQTAAANTTTSGSPSSGATATTSQNDEFLYGVIGCQYSGNNDAALGGAWSNSFTPAQDTHGTIPINIGSGYNTVSSTGAYTAAKTGITTTNLVACGSVIVTYKNNF